MKKLLGVAAVALTVLALPAFAADAPAKPKALSASQQRMAQCNQDASGKKGDERRAFMKSCLAAKRQSQQDKMRNCNKEAGDRKGDERRAFMKSCLSA